jgi:site-specific DNA-methyltransferase (adenine-specific)
MWDCINQLSYKTTPTLLFATHPFLAELIHSNIKHFKFNWIWDKHSISSPFLSKYQPSRVHEEIAVFYEKTPNYKPQKVPQRHGGDRTRTSEADMKYVDSYSECYNNTIKKRHYYVDDGLRYPQSILCQCPCQMEECENNKRYHPTQKPVALLEYLIKTYTNEEDLVLDFTMGSGSTGVACLNTNRNFIGIEKEQKYYNIAVERCKEYQSKLI